MTSRAACACREAAAVREKAIAVQTAERTLNEKRKRGKRQMEKKRYKIEEGAELPFQNHVDFCIGTGRMGLALQREYQ